jgi:hypothetical protein
MGEIPLSSVPFQVIRKNVMRVDQSERDKLRDAFIALNDSKKGFVFPGNRDDKPFTGGVSYWFKQDEIHHATHVHRGPAFLTWHRELCNRFERLLRIADETVSLHYWDWNDDPQVLFNEQFMGSSQGEAGEPWIAGGFYNPYPIGDNYRGKESSSSSSQLSSMRGNHDNPADPPITITRQKKTGSLRDFITKENQDKFYTDKEIIESDNYSQMRLKLEHVHDYAHVYIGGTIGNPHTAFRDPFVFLIHSNVDRLFAAWQLRKGKEYQHRVMPALVYGDETNTVAMGSTSPFIVVGIRTMLSPWCGIGYPYGSNKNTALGEKEEPGVLDVRPWTYPENWHRDPNIEYEKPKNSLHPSVVIPQNYDDFPEGFEYDMSRLEEQKE